MTKSDLMRKLSRLNKEELIDLLLELNKKDNKVFFDVKFKSLDKKTIKTIIEGYVKKAYVKGYVPASKAEEAYEGVFIVLDKILEVNTRLERIELLCHTMNVVMNIQGIDDSNGDLFNVMHELSMAIDHEIIDRLGNHSKEESKNIIDVIFATLEKDNNYGITDFYYDTLNMITVLCSTEELTEYYLKYLEIVIKHVKKSKSDYYSSFELERVLLTKYHAMRFTNEKESIEFLKSNLHYHNFKKEYMNYLMGADDFNLLKQYCDEIIQEGNRSLKDYAFKLLIQVGEQTNDNQLIRENAFKLLLDGEYRVYHLYKDTFTKEEYISEVQNLLKYNESSSWRISLRSFVAIEENLQNVMIEDINKNYMEFFLYYEHLSKSSLNQLQDIYQKVILHQLSHADKRSKYRKVCRLLEQYAKDYQEYPFELIEDIEVNHYRKTALMDEVKILKRKLLKKY